MDTQQTQELGPHAGPPAEGHPGASQQHGAPQQHSASQQPWEQTPQPGEDHQAYRSYQTYQTYQPYQTYQAQPARSVFEESKPAKPPLPNWMSLGSLGVMLFIAGIGLWVMMSSLAYYPGAAGRAVLISTGLIILLAGCVLAYAAWKGYKAGWFLWFTIAGALLSGPVILVGAGLLGTAYVYEDYGRSYEVDVETLNWGWEDEYPAYEDDWWGDEFLDEGAVSDLDDYEAYRYEQLFEQNRDFDLTWLDPNEQAIQVDGEATVLDLTAVPKGQDLAYTVSLNDSTMQVVLTRDQLPLIESLQADGSSQVDAFDFSGYWPREVKQQWLAGGFNADAYPLVFPASSAANQFTFDMQLENSTVEFVVVDRHVALRSHHRDRDGRPGHHGQIDRGQALRGPVGQGQTNERETEEQGDER